MPRFDNFTKGLALGIGVAILVPVAVTTLAPVLKPAARTAVKTGLRAVERGREALAATMEMVEDLVAETETVMRFLAEFLDIEFDDILLIPTFNKSPIKAHTSFKVENHGILQGTQSRYKTLTESELDIIEGMTADIYSKALKEVVKF